MQILIHSLRNSCSKSLSDESKAIVGTITSSFGGLHPRRRGLGIPVNVDSKLDLFRIPDNLAKKSFKRLAAIAGLSPQMWFHDLRHSAAILLQSRGVNVKVVSEMLGHADISITLRIYSHVIPNMQQVAADVMDGLFATKDA
jgi:integrase